jgi:septum formation protein
MEYNYPLFLASSSYSRQLLLTQAKIPFQVAYQNADETICNHNQSLELVVQEIAIHKMNHVLLDTIKDYPTILVLTADTLSQDPHGTIEGKPQDYNHARQQLLTAATGVSRVATAFCLDKKSYKDGQWHTVDRIVHVVESSYRFAVPARWVDTYLANSIGLKAAGAIAVEEFGAPFLEHINGSYSGLVGLPLYELRSALEKMNFFEF